MKKYLENHRSLLGGIGGTVAFVVAMVYLSFTPAEAVAVSGWQKIILLYGHSVCWMLLGGACVSWARGSKRATGLALAGLAVYGVFVVVLLVAGGR